MSNNKAILVAIDRGDFNVDESLEELELLSKSIGIYPIERIIQRRAFVDPRWYLGRGKIEKLAKVVGAFDIGYVIIDDEITAQQKRNIEDITQAEVLDRTQVILEIFAKHASSEEGKIQVELAKLQYELPRMIGIGKELSRLGGGIGTRGPGEQILQRKRSVIKKRISILKKKLEDIKKERGIQKRKRISGDLYRVSIVGYTNSGKSSLLNVLSKREDAKVANELFATLQPITRRVKLPSGKVILVSDTVGFIRKLPHTIIEAFKTTLEEIKDSDLLVHVVDISDPFFETKIRESMKVLKEIDADKIPRVMLFNKIDLIPKEVIEETMERFPDALFSSVKNGIGILEILEKIEDELSSLEDTVRCLVPVDKIGRIYSLLDRISVKEQKLLDGKFELVLKGRRELISEAIGKIEGEVLG